MQISRDDIVRHLEQAGDTDRAAGAAAELPAQVDVEDATVQEKYGVDLKQLLSEIGSGTGDDL